ncbi:hypothetical protein CC1G_13908 [Coprinopsis cinerea okayama7|uniref:BRCT domain-containing protein n=1 Tax=Coprinopsis cinerea (strain Okayama-7 / 130 / ATCC MYA-4618 / FGSC 9003) TaxID=240176 RepID=D6RKX6_COPC7|nr:hypothetical protein CC1G_13908 [Coprinopsis cinerea okayama7\|eukprot:XP_002911868.1 hypothetical protein CC1G_13908 [Coprinopsis cinerea okayama7\
MPRRGGPIVAELQGNVLVESTPTNSASSQDHSAEQLHPNEEATQLVDDYDSDSDPPSSLGASLFVPGPPVPAEPEKQSENTSEWVATQAATQVVDEVATQLDEPTTVAGASHYATAHTTTGPSVQSAQPNNVGPRSLLGLVPPGNRYRYNNYRGPQVQQQPPQPPAVPSTTTSAGPALPYYNLLDPTQRNNLSQANWEETQPNYVPPPAPSSPVPPPADVSGSRVQDVGSDDAMDIVPDSEAQRLGPQKPASDVEMQSDEEESPAHAPKNKKPESKGSNVVVPSSESEEESDTNSDERPTKRRAIEREQESEEDDIPLASNAKRTKNVAKTANKGKAKSIATEEGVKPPSNSKPAQTGRTARKKPEPVPAVTTRGMQKKANIANRSWETGVVPSSIPEEEVTPAPAAGKRKAKGKKQAARAPAAKGRKPLEDEEEVEATDEEGGGDGPEGGEVESTPAPSGPSRGNKRKRGGNAKAGQKAVAKREAKRQAAQPKADKGKDHDRMAKLLRSAKRNPNATRVFAHWQPDGYWYPGIVKCYQDPTHWVVKFDDNNEAHLSIEQMRLADLRVDDEVCYGGSKVFFSVTNVDKLAKGLITVRTPQGETELPVKDIRISPTTINVKWKDRMVDPELIQPYLDNVHGQQSPSQGTNVLWKTAVVLTSSVNNASQNKESFMTASQKTGAIIVEDLVSFFNMTGEWQEAGKRWVIKKQDVELNRKDICRLFLLADGANQKPKYLMALGLGIPCLSLKWLETCAAENEDVDWPPFLLPQGQYNDSCLTQMVDLNWGTSAYHLANIMDNPAPMKLMKGTSVLCVGHDIFPQPKGKSHPNNEQGFQDGINYCTRIILAMGADSVEAVLNPDFASRGFDDYTYIVTRAPPAENKWPELPRSRLVDWSWVKSCLIANRLLPTPELPQQEHSQEV